MSTRLRTYSLCIGCAFWSALVAWLVVVPSPLAGSAKLPALLALAVAGEELVMRGRGHGDGGGAALSLSAVAHVAAAILLAPAAAALTAALGVVLSDGLRRDARRYLLINSAMFGGSTWIAATVYHALNGGHRWSFAAIPAFFVLITLRYLVTSGVFAGGMAVIGAGPFVGLAWRAVVEEVPSALGEGSMGVLVAFGFGHDPALLPFLLPLLGALFFSRANLERLRSETEHALQAMADVIDSRDPTTSEHSERVAELVKRFVSTVGLPHREAERLVAAARFHDLGKIAVDTSTLAAADRLTDAQMAQIRLHPKLSAQLLRPFTFAREISEFASLHHERWDGTGYFGVSGEQVPIEAHVLVAADSFDAMTSERPYRPALTTAEAVEELLDKAGSQFHPTVAKAFAAVILGEPLDNHLSDDELAGLRNAFSRVPVLPRSGGFSADPRLLAMVGLVAMLAALGVSGAPVALAVALGALTATLLAYWLMVHLRVRGRRARAAAAAEAGLPSARVVAAAGFDGWVTSIGAQLEQATGSGASAAELREVQSWLRLGAPARTRRLASGVWAVRSEAAVDERHVVLGLARRPRVYEVELAEWLADAVQANLPEPAPVAPRRPDGERAIARIDLRAFERLRLGAGQLVAERVVEDTGRRLRAAIRASDAVLRLGDDVFALSLVVDGDALEAVERRLRATIADVPVPQRLDPLDPEVVIATAAEARHRPELAEIEDALLPAVLPA